MAFSDLILMFSCNTKEKTALSEIALPPVPPHYFTQPRLSATLGYTNGPALFFFSSADNFTIGEMCQIAQTNNVKKIGLKYTKQKQMVVSQPKTQ